MFEVWFWDVPKLYFQVEHAPDEGLRFSTTFGWLELTESGTVIPYSHVIELRHYLDEREGAQYALVVDDEHTQHKRELRRHLASAMPHSCGCNLFINDDRLHSLLDRIVRYLDDSIERDEEREKRAEERQAQVREARAQTATSALDEWKSRLTLGAQIRCVYRWYWERRPEKRPAGGSEVLTVVRVKPNKVGCEALLRGKPWRRLWLNFSDLIADENGFKLYFAVNADLGEQSGILRAKYEWVDPSASSPLPGIRWWGSAALRMVKPASGPRAGSKYCEVWDRDSRSWVPYRGHSDHWLLGDPSSEGVDTYACGCQYPTDGPSRQFTHWCSKCDQWESIPSED